ncbi:probable calcium-binding protein CML41 [Malania oleifera]|uniref:probable calcium-binding protein CML41 n=1 Tax=Malania oleifera TaxID=397392 RepID=UPI0025AD9F6B|nr:probable calcium-binding protein CML41 [Malania oleifera]
MSAATATASASASASKPQSKWFSGKGFRLSLPRLRSKPKSPTAPMSPSLPAISSKQDELREVFRRFDCDGDGKISCEGLRDYFVSIGESISEEDAQKVICDFDLNGDNLLDFEDFVRLMERGSEGDGDDDLRRAFEMFEVEKGSGCITPRGLQRMLSRLGDAKSYEECEAMIRVFDLDGNGVLDFHEFHQMMA